MGGKIVRVSTNTDSKTTAKLRLLDIKAEERKKTERANPALTNIKTFGDALDVLERRIKATWPQNAALHELAQIPSAAADGLPVI